MSVTDYLALERASEKKHEYMNGEAFAMAGGTPRHSAVCANVVIALGNALRGMPCRVYQSDLRVHVAATGLYTYPDATVVCGPAQTAPADPRSVTNPKLIVEVLSPGTEAEDRGAKFRHYQSIPSLEEYLLVSSEERRVEQYRRVGPGQWLFTALDARDDQTVELPSVGAALRTADLYAQLDAVPA